MKRCDCTNARMTAMYLGVLLIIIALILGGLQLFNIYDFTPALGRHLYVYGLFGVIGLIGIILAAWSLLTKEAPKVKPAQTKT